MLKEIRYLLLGLVLGGVLIYFIKPEPAQKELQTEALLPLEPVTPRLNNAVISGYSLPEQISFAGEEVPMGRPDVKERLDREIQVNAFWHSNAIILIKRANKWLPVIDSTLRANGVPADFKYLAVAESGLQNAISPANAVGFWQFLSGTAKDFGLIVNHQVDQRYDPIKSTVAAAKYFKKAHQKFGNWTMAAASYNMGMRGVSQVAKNQRAKSYYDMIVSEEPSRYVFRIIAIKNLLENPADYSFAVDSTDLYQMPASRPVSVEEDIEDWNDFAESHEMTFYELKQLNPWIRDYKMTVKKGQKFTVLVSSAE
ncbi:lytic transglycosylase domain-containing protein [Reichenbachiella agarivorans]|uniref:Lytic transglycosylase domain-containing protein n=1 Tax=Reichenbachiella agarivorans TaxID=2979464 RepID=A0ABY6CWG4_9BACT|nr:lytic transglycosylase domain-containing protein [Reichenbachiella agarivorans]UXP33733.1 lytic transglycosylase domain-containing protein [Reichenbachiella agarivorans]